MDYKKEGTLNFTTTGLGKNYEMQPFYDTHHCRYNVYWKIGDGIDLQKEREPDSRQSFDRGTGK